jgi:glycosyltransferase involved in cell wall biosynthesis
MVFKTGDIKVVVTTPSWSLNGPNVFAANLVSGLLTMGIASQIVLTRPDWSDAKPLPVPPNVPIVELPIPRFASLRVRWRTLIRYLEELAPCIYIPNYDFIHSSVSPRLSDRVPIVGIIHSDDPQHYEHVARLGRYWNAIVAVSPAIAAQAETLDASFASRTTVIPYGVEVADTLPERRQDSVLRIVYAGRLVQYQKRILDLPRIVRALVDRGVPVQLSIAGSGSDQRILMEACAAVNVQQQVSFLGTLSSSRMRELMTQNDAFILTSEFEGLPLSMLEAMGQGCIPVVSDIRSGIPDLIQNGVNGYRVPVGDIQKFADCFSSLHRDVGLRREMVTRAYKTIVTGGYSVRDMLKSYVTLFERVVEQSERGTYHRPLASILPSPSLPWPEYLPGSLQRIGHYGKRLFAEMKN